MFSTSTLIKVIVIPALLGLTLSACATSRSVVDISTPEAGASKGDLPVKIVEVRDLRKFEVNPRDPSLPSLGDDEEIQDTKLTSRALARKRNGFGKALGDVMLPEGKTVSMLVQGAATKALQDRGYTVVSPGSPDYGRAMPVSIEIEQFWAWFTPGFWQITLQFDSRLAMRGDNVLVESPVTVNGQASIGAAGAFESTWTEVIQTGVNNLTERIKDKVKSASQVRPVTPVVDLRGTTPGS